MDGAAFLLGLTKQVEIIEGAIAVVIIALLVVILVLNQRKKRAVSPQPPAQNVTQNYYADLQQQAGGEPDPFAGFGNVVETPAAPPPVPTEPVAPPVMVSAAAPVGNSAPVQSVPSMPAVQSMPTVGSMPTVDAAPAQSAPLPGTPAGWLQDPSGDPDTLRYWDGSAWTQHVAQRT